MDKRVTVFSQWSTVCLHLFLVAGIVLFVYTPFLDHSLGLGIETRQHQHVLLSFSAEGLSETHIEHDDHDETYLCTLNLDAVLGLILGFEFISQLDFTPQNTLSVAIAADYQRVATIFLPTIDPPPNSF